LVRRHTDLEPERLIFITDTWTATAMSRRHGHQLVQGAIGNHKMNL
jgi:hypothetical protein